jgi:hypothetical protein
MLIPPGAEEPDVVPLDALPLDAVTDGGWAVAGDPEVEPVPLEFEPVHAVSSNITAVPTAVPVSLDRLLVMIMRRL